MALLVLFEQQDGDRTSTYFRVYTGFSSEPTNYLIDLVLTYERMLVGGKNLRIAEIYEVTNTSPVVMTKREIEEGVKNILLEELQTKAAKLNISDLQALVEALGTTPVPKLSKAQKVSAATYEDMWIPQTL